MAVRSKKLWPPTVVAGASTVLYTCPAGKTALLKHVQVVNTAALAQTLSLYIGAAVTANYLATITAPGTGSSSATPWFIVLHPGDVLRGVASGTGVTVSGFGAELLGVAS